MIKSKTKQIIDVSDFDDLVQKTYGRVYSFQQQDNCKARGVEYFTVPIKYPEDYENDSVPEKVNGEEMGVSFRAWLARDPKQKWDPEIDDWELGLFWERNFYPHVDMVLNDLYTKGLIEAGEYGIDIDW